MADSFEEQVVYSARRFQVCRVQYTAPDETRQIKEIVRHPGAVTIVPVLDEDRLCLIRNYRVAVDETLLELPAGTLEVGEQPLDTARRELAEETGYEALHWQSLGSFFMSPGVLDERMYLFVARGLTSGPAAREAGEWISNYPVSWQEALAMVLDGRIHDAKTIVGILKFAAMCR